MPRILHIETATQVCSLALSERGQLKFLRESSQKNIHSSVVTVFIEEMMRESGWPFISLDAVSVSMGPGSYTGLRIGVSTAKGICYALDKPLIAIGTLQAMAAGMAGMESLPTGTPSLFCPMIDAKRMEVYSALYDQGLHPVREILAEIITEESFTEELRDHTVVFAGDGAAKCKPLLQNHPNAVFLDDFRPSAKFMIPLAEEKFRRQQFENTAYFEPFYLKDFIPGIPRVKGLA
ncbi:MAG: tRNA (adenosine(37)-N6)-threonylcarbamoyltransferase complex dimerization subunit type 1 TsaB [Bacteroidales bacterium]